MRTSSSTDALFYIYVQFQGLQALVFIAANQVFLGTVTNLNCGYGTRKIISLDDLWNPSKGFVLNDCILVEVEFLVVSETKYFSESSSSKQKESSESTKESERRIARVFY